MGSGPSKPDTSAQEASLELQQTRLKREEKLARESSREVALGSQQEFLARRRGQRGSQSLIRTSARGTTGLKQSRQLTATRRQSLLQAEQALEPTRAREQAELDRLARIKSQRSRRRTSGRSDIFSTVDNRISASRNLGAPRVRDLFR